MSHPALHNLGAALALGFAAAVATGHTGIAESGGRIAAKWTRKGTRYEILDRNSQQGKEMIKQENYYMNLVSRETKKNDN